MNLVQSGQSFSFNYTTYDENPSLFIAFSIYNVTTGTPIFVSKINAQYAALGAYVATLIPAAGQTYLIIGLVYTDGTYATVDSTRSPTAQVFQSIQVGVPFFGFAYASYDQLTNLNLQGSVYDLTLGSPVFVTHPAMVSVINGVYFGSYNGMRGHTYQVVSAVYTDNSFSTPNLNYAPGCDEYEYIQPTPNILVTGVATLIGESDGLGGFNHVQPIQPPLRITQGDDALFFLTCVDGDGNPVDLTGAIFQSFVNEANGHGILSIPNNQHFANPDQINFAGQFQLTLNEVNTQACGQGSHKELLTLVTIGSTSVMFRAPNSLQVYLATPFA